MDQVSTAIEFLVTAVFTEAFAVSFLVGLVIFLLGLALTVLFAISRLTGQRTVGTVVGAVQIEKHKTRVRNGETLEKVKQTLFPVYEFVGTNGRTRQLRGSEGGTMTMKYTTGQSVNLIVREDGKYDNIYDADEHGTLYLAIGMLLVGGGVMAWAGSAAAAVGVGVMAISLAVVGFFARGLVKKFLGPKDSTKKTTRRETSELRPIEFYQAQKGEPLS